MKPYKNPKHKNTELEEYRRKRMEKWKKEDKVHHYPDVFYNPGIL